ncbi:MAG: mechanosensitive ion channel family protein [Firmicutes bacterium]|nr:mechanosensitive ion channel family protein [Bacillota bacterium]
MLKSKMNPGTLRNIIVLSVIGAVVVFTIVIAVFFGNTPFGNLVANSFGKFFNVWVFLQTKALILLETAGIIFFVWALNQVVHMLIGLIVKKRSHRSTIWIIIRSIFKYGTEVVGVFLILSTWGVETPTLLAGAGILGLALSFGAQSLIEDVIAGLFIIFEKQFVVGDIIQVAGFRGTVLEIGVRTTTFEDLNGDVMVMNNSDLRMTINTSINPSPSICDIAISYSEDLERVERIIRSHLDEIKAKIPDIIEGPFYKGVQSLGESSVVLRIYARTDETKKGQVTRELNKEMKLLFDHEGIEIPFSQLVVRVEDPEKFGKK